MTRISRTNFSLVLFAGSAIIIALTLLAVLLSSGASFGPSLFKSVAGGLVAAGLSGGLYIALTRTVFRRAAVDRDVAKRLSEQLSRAGGGDLSEDWEDISILVNGGFKTIPLKQVYDRLVDVLVESDRMSNELNHLAREILDQAVRLTQSAEDQSESVSESRTSIDRIDYTVRDVVGNVDDLQELGDNVSSATYEMIASIDQVNSNAQSLNQALQEAAGAIEEMVSNIHSVAESTDSLSMATVQSRRSMEDIDRSTQMIRDRAEETAKLSEASREGADKTKDMVGKTVQGIRALADNIESTRGVMNKLGIQSRSIGEILTVISSVASDTHLLSLNASIMAAKAGEHGRGFAVVAQEIKTLAHRTAESAKEIENLIMDTQESVDKAIQSIESGAEQVGQGLKLTEEADKSLAEQLERAEVAARNAHDIARKTYDQAELSQEVMKAVDEVAGKTELIQAAMREQEDSNEFVMKRMTSTQDMMEQVAHAMREQAQSSRQISSSMDKLTSSIQGIKMATEEQAKSSKGIVRAVQTIHKKADLVAISSQNVSNTSMSVLHQAMLLRSELKGIVLPEKGARFKLGLLFDNLREERWKRERGLFQKRAAELGIETEFRAAEGDSKKQYELGVELLDLGIDLLIIVAVDAEAAGDIVSLARERNLPAIVYDRLVKNVPLDLFVSFDASRIGQLQAETAIKKVPGGKIMVLTGSPTDMNAHMLYNGQMELLRPASDSGLIELVEEKWTPDWSPDEAYRLTKEAINKHGTLDAVVAANDGTASGAIRAIEELLPDKKVVVTGMDTELSACKRIVEGRQDMTVYMPIKLQSARAMEAALLMLRGEEIPGITDHIDNGAGLVPAILLRPIKIDKDNLEEVVIKDGFHKRQEVFGSAQ